MKARKLFFGALTCLAFAACSNDDDLTMNNGGAQAEGTKAFLAVQLSMPGDGATRADISEETYKVGDNAEVTVNTAHLFFFKENEESWGACKSVTNQILGNDFDNTATNSNSPENWVDGNGKTIDNISPVFIMFENQAIPHSVVAVLNLTDAQAATLQSLTLPDFRKKLHTETYKWNCISTGEGDSKKGNFIMSNSVYYTTTGTEGSSTNAVVYAQELANYLVEEGDAFGESKVTAENIQQAAKANPLTIPVERVLARVHVNLTETVGESDAVTATNVTGTYKGPLWVVEENELKQNEEVTIYSTANGWWLDNTNKESYLVKDAENNSGWPTVPEGGENWSNSTYQRSYWANAVNGGEAESSKKFAHYDYQDYINNINDKYCFENTNQNNKTTLVVAANLFLKNADGTYSRLDMVRHIAQNYTVDAFKLYVLKRLEEVYPDGLYYTTSDNNTKSKLTTDKLELRWNKMAKKDGAANYTPENITIGTGEEAKAIEDWQAVIQLKNVTVYDSDGENGKDITSTINDWLLNKENGIGAFQYFNRGKTYYFTEIDHLNSTQAVIRNHYYAINVTGITGLGTPVPSNDPDQTDPDPTDPGDDPKDPEDPEVPEDPEDNPDDPNNDNPDDDDPDKPIIPEQPKDDKVSAIATEISILKYRVVTNSDVQLGGGAGSKN